MSAAQVHPAHRERSREIIGAALDAAAGDNDGRTSAYLRLDVLQARQLARADGAPPAPRYNVSAGEDGYLSRVAGYEVEYPVRCNGMLADLAFIVYPNGYASSFVNIGTDGRAYGAPMPDAVRERIERMRADVMRGAL